MHSVSRCRKPRRRRSCSDGSAFSTASRWPLTSASTCVVSDDERDRPRPSVGGGGYARSEPLAPLGCDREPADRINPAYLGRMKRASLPAGSGKSAILGAPSAALGAHVFQHRPSMRPRTVDWINPRQLGRIAPPGLRRRCPTVAALSRRVVASSRPPSRIALYALDHTTRTPLRAADARRLLRAQRRKLITTRRVAEPAVTW